MSPRTTLLANLLANLLARRPPEPGVARATAGPAVRVHATRLAAPRPAAAPRARALALACAFIAASGATAQEAGALRAPAPRLWGTRPAVAELASLGRQIFSDAGLSASAKMACATCHDPAAAFGPNADTPSPFADGDPAHAGTRAIPSLRYALYLPPFSEHFLDDEDGHGVDAGPTGGLTWDGRADSGRAQALIPLFAAHEMGNADVGELARRVAQAPYARAFRQAFSAPGRDVFDNPQQVVAWTAFALEVFEQTAPFHPFSSKYDRALAGQATLSAAELRGLKLYKNELKGHCDSCHPSSRSSAGGAPIFTDGGLLALGVPRRAELPPVAASGSGPSSPATVGGAADYDLGLCRSGRPGLSADPGFCGRFRTPTLRNVALRTSFFHNGAVHSLRDAVAFYATRDTDPGHWYPRNADGSVRVYDDLPPELRAGVDHDMPFRPTADGRPRLEEQEIDDIVAFLGSLTDADAQVGTAPSTATARTTTASPALRTGRRR